MTVDTPASQGRVTTAVLALAVAWIGFLALYQGWHVLELVVDPGALETIPAGGGRTAADYWPEQFCLAVAGGFSALGAVLTLLRRPAAVTVVTVGGVTGLLAALVFAVSRQEGGLVLAVYLIFVYALAVPSALALVLVALPRTRRRLTRGRGSQRLAAVDHDGLPGDGA